MLSRFCPPGLFLSTIRAFKRGIVCLCTIFTFPVNLLQSSKYGIVFDREKRSRGPRNSFDGGDGDGDGDEATIVRGSFDI